MTGLTGVSLFAGIGGFDLAMERAGIRVTAMCEIDKHAQSVLRRNFTASQWTSYAPELFPDVTELTADDILATGFDPENGILTAGWPCQGNSVAGLRGGMDDPRSGLWRHVARLVAEVGPRWFIGENVPGLLTVRGGADFRQVLQDLDGLGYGLAWRVLDAQHFGVPQRRRRVLIAGCLGDPAGAAQILLEPEGGSGHSAQGAQTGARVAGTLAASAGGGGLGGVGQSANAITSRIVETYKVSAPVRSSNHYGDHDGATSQLVVTGTLTAGMMTDYDDNTARAGLMVTAHHTSGAGWWSDGVGTLRSEGGGGTPEQVIVSTLQGGGNRGYRVDAEAAAGGHLIPQPTAVRRLTPLECERLQGFPDGWTDGQSDAARYRQLGNAVAVPVAEWVMRRLVATESARLSTRSEDAA